MGKQERQAPWGQEAWFIFVLLFEFSAACAPNDCQGQWQVGAAPLQDSSQEEKLPLDSPVAEGKQMIGFCMLGLHSSNIYRHFSLPPALAVT